MGKQRNSSNNTLNSSRKRRRYSTNRFDNMLKTNPEGLPNSQSIKNEIPDYVIGIGDRLYNFNLKLYGASFALCFAFASSVYPYIFVSDCKFMYSAKSAMNIVIFFIMFYFIGVVVLVVTNFWSAFSNFILVIISIFFKNGFRNRNMKRHYYDPNEKGEAGTKAFFSVIAFVFWAFGTAMAIRILNVDLNVPEIWGAVNELAKSCPPGNSP